MSDNKQMTVRRIEPQTECTRMLLYGDDPHYHVIADLPSPDIKVGDAIEYEPYGVNFGFLITEKMRELIA